MNEGSMDEDSQFFRSNRIKISNDRWLKGQKSWFVLVSRTEFDPFTAVLSERNELGIKTNRAIG